MSLFFPVSLLQTQTLWCSQLVCLGFLSRAGWWKNMMFVFVCNSGVINILKQNVSVNCFFIFLNNVNYTSLYLNESLKNWLPIKTAVEIERNETWVMSMTHTVSIRWVISSLTFRLLAREEPMFRHYMWQSGTTKRWYRTSYFFLFLLCFGNF